MTWLREYLDNNSIEKSNVKIIAFYLPQFHECDENNIWWGSGFTEWTNTKKTNPLFIWHNQPREPLDDYYYDLTCKEDILWQMRIAKNYHIYGFCIYNYWFAGRKILYKPLELIRNLDIKEKIPYCICWANETWSRRWDDSEEVLIEQTYGNIKEWDLHFNYLLEFFQDESYMKINNEPILVLYRSKDIPQLEERINYYRKRCIDNGFSGIYVIDEYNCYQNESICHKSLQFEPLYTMKYGRSDIQFKYFKFLSKIFNWGFGCNKLVYSYSVLWRNILKRNIIEDSYLGAFVDWDNTARKGKNGRIVLGTSVYKFSKYMKKLKKKAENSDSEYIFINAWNEWGEGTYLEPDKKNKNKYLLVIRDIFSN